MSTDGKQTTDSLNAATARAFTIAVGLTSLTILLQGVWAGILIREGQDNNDFWVEVHDWGARVAIALALVATVLAAARLRQPCRRARGRHAHVTPSSAEPPVGAAEWAHGSQRREGAPHDRL